MLTTSKYIMHGSSTRCTFCNKPFCSRDGYVELWRASNGEHFCSEFCADDAEEAQFFVCSIPPRLQVLRPPIQPNHTVLNLQARTDDWGGLGIPFTSSTGGEECVNTASL